MPRRNKTKAAAAAAAAKVSPKVVGGPVLKKSTPIKVSVKKSTPIKTATPKLKSPPKVPPPVKSPLMTLSPPKKIGEGAYGCVYHPALPCLSSKNNGDKEVTKYMQMQEAETQLAEAQRIKKLDPKSEFTIGEPHMCRPTGRPSDCTLSLSKPTILVYPYGGKTLWSVMAEKPLDYKTILRKFGKLIEGVAILNEESLLHFDIKEPNIVTGVKPSDPYRLIDFGFTSHVNDVNPGLFAPYYPYWPVDAVLVIDGITEAQIRENIHEALNDTVLIWFYTKILRRPVDSSLRVDDLARRIPRTKEARLTILRKVDVYSLGRILLNFVYYNYKTLPEDIRQKIFYVLEESLVLDFDSRYKANTQMFSAIYNQELLPLL